VSNWIRSLTRARESALRMDFLWAATVIAGCVILTSLVPLPPNDFWWHLKIGEIIWETGSIPEANMFAWTIPSDQPFFYAAWLSELGFYTLYRLGGLELVTFARNLLLAVALFIVAHEAHRRSGSWKVTALVLGVGFVSMMSNLIIRPQIGSWIPFVVFMTLLARYAEGALDKKALLICPLTMALWVNLHGAFVLGVALMGLFGASMILRCLLSKRTQPCSWARVGWLAAVGVLTVAATLINPKGFRIFDYVVNLMTDQPSQRLIMEWQSPTPEGIANTVFFASVLLFLVAAWFSRKPPKIADVLLIASFLWLAWQGVRYVMWFSLVAVPILAQLIAGLFTSTRWLVAPYRNRLNNLIAMLLLVPVILVQPWFVDALHDVLPDKYWEMVITDTGVDPLVGTENPVGAVGYLAEHPSSHMFNEMGYGSYFIWALPDQSVFVDPRVELYPYELWQDYRRISNGVRPLSLLRSYGVERVVLDLEIQPDLSLALEDQARWKLVYADTRTEIWDLQD
jgi:hypothetical protein